jgi:nucleotide-binding universal stress UspA family protein
VQRTEENPMTTPSTRNTAPLVVVGVDGSSGSQKALDFALAEGALRGAEVRAVCTWEFPVTYDAGFVLPFEGLEDVAAAILGDAVALAVKDRSGTTPHVTTAVRHGHSAKVLVDEAKDASMLVVGSRGHGGFVGMLLGSVSQGCVTHAPCPVVVVPEPTP